LDVTEPSAFAGFPAGTVLLDKYRIIREVGVGGMGMVVCAEHIALGTQVALKFLLPEFAVLPAEAERFSREARAAARIQSEHIARVLDSGTLPPGVGLAPGVGLDPAVPNRGQPFIVMEYLEGKDLGRHLKAGRLLSIHEAIDYTVQAAEALSQAHRAGIVHRDIKPANLFVTSRPDGSPLVKVLDFGISKLVEEATHQNVESSRTTTVMGSALYMSLEQMRSAKSVDQRSDIYALGVTLYEMLTGTHPFTADSFSDLCVKVSLDPPNPLRRHRSDVPEELAEVIAKAYARYPDDRYATMGSFVAALAPFAAVETQATIGAILRFESLSTGELPIVRRLTPLTNRAVTVQRPRQIPWGMIATAIGLAAAAAGATTWYLLSRLEGIVLAGLDAGHSAEPVISAPLESVSVIPIATSSALPRVPPPLVPSSAPAVSASASHLMPRPPECKKPTDFYIDTRTGMRRPCL
jgi:serine/threonine-protein kinase